MKWAFVEAANSALLNAERCGYGHISRLYQRIKPRRGHGKAKVAVARHLSEASFWMLKKGEPYREPMSSRNAKRAGLMGHGDPHLIATAL